MAKRIVVVLATLVPLVARAADLSAGTVEVVGSSSLQLSSSSSKLETSSPSGSTATTDRTSYGLGVAGIYYLTPNVGLGLRGSFGSEESKTGGQKDTLKTFGIGPLVALELPLQDRLALAVQGSIGYVRTSWTAAGGPSDLRASGYDIGIGAGVKYYVTKAFSLNAGVAYAYQKLDYTFSGMGSTTVKGTTSDLGATVGLSVYFGQ